RGARRLLWQTRMSAPPYLQLFDPDIPPANLKRFFAGADAVHLQGDDPFGGQVVFQIDGWHAVDPSLDRIAAAFNAELVPVVLFEGIAGGFVVRQVGQKSPATGLVVDRAAVRPGGGIDLDLIAVHAIDGDRLFLALDFQIRRFVEHLA